MHANKRAAKITGTGGKDKGAVMGLLERHGPDGHSRVRVKHVANTRRATLAPEVRAHVEPGANVYTDALKSYDGLSDAYAHAVIDHAEAYVRGNVHTNGLENFWSLLKRAIKGTYVSVEPFHLFRYLDEQAYRFNTRKAKEGPFRRYAPRCRRKARHLQESDRQVAACYDVRVSRGSGGENAWKAIRRRRSRRLGRSL